MYVFPGYMNVPLRYIRVLERKHTCTYRTCASLVRIKLRIWQHCNVVRQGCNQAWSDGLLTTCKHVYGRVWKTSNSHTQGGRSVVRSALWQQRWVHAQHEYICQNTMPSLLVIWYACSDKAQWSYDQVRRCSCELSGNHSLVMWS